MEWYSKRGAHLERRIGSAPAIAEKGDTVCMLFGGFDFYLLRDGDQGYQLLGTCDIHDYEYEWNVANHKTTGRPTHHFEIY